MVINNNNNLINQNIISYMPDISRIRTNLNKLKLFMKNVVESIVKIHKYIYNMQHF